MRGRNLCTMTVVWPSDPFYFRRCATRMPNLEFTIFTYGRRVDTHFLGYQLGLIHAIATSHGPCVCYACDLCRKLTERCVRLAEMNCDYGWCRGGNIGGVFGFFGGLSECD
jgi:hypothetical protein